jgi:hypothetical protein
MDLERSDRGLIKTISRHLPGGTEQYHEKPVTITGSPAEIRNNHLRNTSPVLTSGVTHFVGEVRLNAMGQLQTNKKIPLLMQPLVAVLEQQLFNCGSKDRHFVKYQRVSEQNFQNYRLMYRAILNYCRGFRGLLFSNRRKK